MCRGPKDLGFMRQADAVGKVLGPLLKELSKPLSPTETFYCLLGDPHL